MRVRFLLCVIDIYRKYAWIVPLKDKEAITITNTFQKILNKFGLKPNRRWVDQDSECLVASAALHTKLFWVENKTPNITNLGTKTTLNTKAIEFERKIPGITNLANKAALNMKSTETENKIPDITNLP